MSNTATCTHLLYLHGFRSSPQSFKAQMVLQRVAQQHPHVQAHCPQLPPSPQAAYALIRQLTADWPRQRMAVVGSSLGGFYATRLAYDTDCRAVLLNPAVHPARDLARYIGEQSIWHNPADHFYFSPAYVAELETMACGTLHAPERVFAVVAQGDEVLDWREMVARYPNCRIKLLPGSDHALSDFEQHMDDVFAHLNLV
jgi:uncharacterized protein